MTYYRSLYRNHERTRHPYRRCNDESFLTRSHQAIGILNARQWNPGYVYRGAGHGYQECADRQKAKTGDVIRHMRRHNIST